MAGRDFTLPPHLSFTRAAAREEELGKRRESIQSLDVFSFKWLHWMWATQKSGKRYFCLEYPSPEAAPIATTQKWGMNLKQ